VLDQITSVSYSISNPFSRRSCISQLTKEKWEPYTDNKDANTEAWQVFGRGIWAGRTKLIFLVTEIKKNHHLLGEEGMEKFHLTLFPRLGTKHPGVNCACDPWFNTFISTLRWRPSCRGSIVQWCPVTLRTLPYPAPHPLTTPLSSFLMGPHRIIYSDIIKIGTFYLVGLSQGLGLQLWMSREPALGQLRSN
jgi:hypothetical protein